MSFVIINWTGPGMRHVVGFADRSTERGTFRGELVARHCNQWGLYGVGVRQCLNRRSCGLGWCVWWAETLLYYMGARVVQGNGRFLGFLFSIFTMGNAIGSPTVKCLRFVYENLTAFPFGKHIVGKLDSWAFWRYIPFRDQRRGLWEISKKVTILLPKLRCTQQNDAACGALTAAAAADGQLHIYECTPRRSAARPTAWTARRDAALYPNYFGQTCYY